MSAHASSSAGPPTTQVGDGISAPTGVWTFGGDTPSGFEGHVARSIPAYHECHDLILDLAEELVPAGGRCYDLGCSTGALTARLAERLAPRGVEIVAVDREPGMIEMAAERLARHPSVRFVTSPLESLTLEPADLAVCFYTLQFTTPRQRPSILSSLHQALAPHGALILFEKVLASTARGQRVTEGVYFEHKRRQGFSNDEIVEKGRSLRGILQPLPAEQNRTLLQVAGFTEVLHVFRWMCFDGVVAYA